jgi:adenylyl cyclase-associated protein
MESLTALLGRLETAVSTLENKLGSVPSNFSPSFSSSAQLSRPSFDDSKILEYDALVQTSFGRVLAAAERIGDQVLALTNLLKEALAVEKRVMLHFTQCKQPSIEGLTKLIQPLSELITKANAFTEGRRSDTYNILKTIAECLPALLWVVYTGKDCGLSLPAVHVEEIWQSAEFFNNKVLVEYKSKDSNRVEWAKALKEFFVPGLRDYVRKNYPVGSTWNPTGVDITEFKENNSSFVPAPPNTLPQDTSLPPPPPPRSLPVSADGTGVPKASTSAVFQEINKGESVTAGLKKVTADMKTKNRLDRQGVDTVGSGSIKARSRGSAFSKEGPPKLELQMGHRWAVENQIGKKNLIIDECNSKQSVYIFGCKDSVVQVQGKVNNISIDKCTKTGVVFMDVMAACKIVNCNGVEVQCQGTVPTVSVDNTAGCHLYLSRSSMGASITTAKSSEVNVLVPDATDISDMLEHALPEQFIHTYKDGQFVTCPVLHSIGRMT